MGSAPSRQLIGIETSTSFSTAITKKRLLAGLGQPGARQLHFFIAEEGITAAAYVVVSIVGGTWTIEECGDRDPTRARVGAILQALIAREPVVRRPTIHAWLPRGFVPPQITIVSAKPSTDVQWFGHSDRPCCGGCLATTCCIGVATSSEWTTH